MSEAGPAEHGHPRHRWPAALRTGAVAAHWAVRVTVSMARRVRRRRLIVALAVRAVWGRARVDHQIATDVALGRHVKFVLTPRTTNTIRIGPNCSIGDDVVVHMYGGRLEFDERVEIRARCALHLGGRLHFEGMNILSYGCTVHCDEHIEVGYMVGWSEYVTVVDSSHTHQGDEWFVANIRSTPVVIGASAWLGAKVTVGRGVHIGERSVVGANSLVISDVPDGCLASGVPAKVIRKVDEERGAGVELPPVASSPAPANGQSRERDATSSS